MNMRFFLSRPKTTLIVILAAVFWFLFSQYAFGAPRVHLQALLTKTFANNNRDYFGGKLPETDIVVVPTLINESGENLFGNSFCLELEGGKVHCTIRVARDYNPANETAVLTLDHEMCHVKLWGGKLNDHGPKFQACMQEGAAMGEFKDVW